MIKSPFDKNISFSVVSSENKEFILHPEEMKILSPRAFEKRRRHFYLGRTAAHNALASLLGDSCIPILKGKRGEPIWPKGIVGTITHTGDIAMAAVAWRKHTNGIGIDIEKLNTKVSFEISRKICTLNELEWVTEKKDEADSRLKMIFSAKESVFKAFYPIEKIYLDFMDAELTWNSLLQGFHGRLLKKAGSKYPVDYTFTVGCRF